MIKKDLNWKYQITSFNIHSPEDSAIPLNMYVPIFYILKTKLCVSKFINKFRNSIKVSKVYCN